MHSSGASRGFVVMLFMAILALVVLTTATSGLWGSSNNAVKKHITREALKQAKASLLAYVAIGNSGANPNTLFDKLGGRLPCPNFDGQGSSAPTCGSTTNASIGIFPWRTLGQALPRDAASECLWLVVNAAHKISPATNSTNADTNGMFSIVQPVKTTSALGWRWSERLIAGSLTNAANRIVAVIIAPGSARSGQTRTRTSLCPAAENATNYTDTYAPASGSSNLDNFTMPTPNGFKTFVQADDQNELLNDELIWITADEYAKAVSQRALKIVGSLIESFAYGDRNAGTNPLRPNGFYPWPAKSPGGRCDPTLVHGYVPSYCTTDEGAWSNWNIGDRMNVANQNDPEHWLSQIHYAVANHCAVRPQASPSGEVTNACLGGAGRLAVGTDVGSVQALLLIRGRDISGTCTTVVATDPVAAPFPTPILASCINGINNQAATTNARPAVNVAYDLPDPTSPNQMLLLRGR